MIKLKFYTCLKDKYITPQIYVIIFHKCQHPYAVCNEMICGVAIESYKLIKSEDVKTIQIPLIIKSADLIA